jgi:hypothetical protein
MFMFMLVFILHAHGIERGHGDRYTDIDKDTNAFTEMNLDIQRFGYLMLRILIGDLT